MPKVSVVVPVYNVGKFLTSCLNSVISQTLQDIEIICVNDGSTDSSLKILRDFEKKDDRFKVIDLGHNLGTFQARKAGVIASTGDYVMFLDGDDQYFPETCKVAYDSIKKTNTDILQFDTQIVTLNNYPDARINNLKNFLKPFLKDTIKCADLVTEVFKNKSFAFTLWNKIFRGETCREALSEIKDRHHLCCAEDLLAFFIIACHSKSYAGIPNVLYKYNFGAGLTGFDIISLAKYKIILEEKDVCDILAEYVNESTNKAYVDIVNSIRKEFMNGCVYNWAHNLSDEDLSVGYELLIKKWGKKDVITCLASQYWDDNYGLAKKLTNVDCIKHIPQGKKKQLTVAIVYKRVYNGGAERVTAELCNLWSSAKDDSGRKLYNVILITEELPNAKDYPINSNIKREFLPPYEDSIKGKYGDRYDAWDRIINENEIDIVITGLWIYPCTFWDMLSVKMHPSKPAFAIHSHSFCAVPFGFSSSNGCTEHVASYLLCDGAVTLSETDREFTEIFSKNVLQINNPITFDPQLVHDSVYEKNSIIWVGRLSSEKKPLDVIRMMSVLVRDIPQAKLYIIGEGDKELSDKVSALIETLGLTKNIELVGFTTDVGKYYSKASVLVSTSKFEGFPLTMCEAKAYALPIVTYDLPWVMFIQDGRGIIAVEQNRYDKLAEKVGYLLKNSSEAKKIGADGKQQLIEMYQHNILSDWQNFFYNATQNDGVHQGIKTNESIILRYITDFQYAGRKESEVKFYQRLNEMRARLNAQISGNKEQNKLNKKLTDTIVKLSTGSAYVDLKTCGKSNSLEFIKTTDEKILKAPWYDDESGLGYRITSDDSSIDIYAFCHGSGTMNVICRGLDVRNPNDAKLRIPVWVRFTTLKIDEHEYIKDSVEVWHNKPYKISIKIKDKQLLHIHAEWMPTRAPLTKQMNNKGGLFEFIKHYLRKKLCF